MVGGIAPFNLLPADSPGALWRRAARLQGARACSALASAHRC